MALLDWALFALAALLAGVVVGYVYRRREAAGRGRGVLAALRWLTLALVLLLLFDPLLPARRAIGAGGAGRTVLVDASLSMALPVRPGGPTRWDSAVAAARRLGARRVMLFGEAPRTISLDSLTRARPTDMATRLLPALESASETGSREAVVLTDGGVQDGVEVARWRTRLGLDLRVVPVAPAPLPDLALSDVEAPGWGEAGKPLRVSVSVASTTSPPPTDSATIVLRRAGKVLARARVAAPSAGRLATVGLDLTPAAEAAGGLVRFEAALERSDSVPEDDVRPFYVFVGERPPGIVLVSFAADWEPRFLQPVLEDALGLPVRGFIAVQNGRYITLGTGMSAGAEVAASEVEKAAGRADLVVLHGLSASSPDWALQDARRHAHALILPGDPAPNLGLGLSLPAESPGDWFASPEVPPSPVAPLLAGLAVQDLPPLEALRPARVPAGDWAPLLASRGRRGGGATPIAVAGEQGGRRWVVALGSGYWQWAFRGGNAREVYQRLWSALAGWLTAESRAATGVAVRAAERVIPRGAPVRFVAPGLAADSVAVAVTGAGGFSLDTTVSLVRGDTAALRPLAPGDYRYRARAFGSGKEAGAAEGPFTVETYTPELIRPLVAPAGFDAAGTPVAGEEVGPRPGIPLHATPIPYVLLVLLVATEWVLRRRWGLR